MNLTITTWNTSTPTAPGWYLASTERSADVCRYWNGAMYSAPCYADDNEERKARAKHTPAESQTGIEWREPLTA